MNNFLPIASLFAATALSAGTAAADDYKVILGISSGMFGIREEVYLPRKPLSVQPAPTLAQVKFRTYTLLAVNERGEHAVCAGMKITPPDDMHIDAKTLSKEAFLYLYPQQDGYLNLPERSYGSCRPVTLADTKTAAGYEFNNANVTVYAHGEPLGSGIGFPILGTGDKNDPRYRHDQSDRELSLRPSSAATRACAAAGFNESHARAEKGHTIKVEFCPR